MALFETLSILNKVWWCHQCDFLQGFVLDRLRVSFCRRSSRLVVSLSALWCHDKFLCFTIRRLCNSSDSNSTVLGGVLTESSSIVTTYVTILAPANTKSFECLEICFCFVAFDSRCTCFLQYFFGLFFTPQQVFFGAGFLLLTSSPQICCYRFVWEVQLYWTKYIYRVLFGQSLFFFFFSIKCFLWDCWSLFSVLVLCCLLVIQFV
jgi:hypothetical protein